SFPSSLCQVGWRGFSCHRPLHVSAHARVRKLTQPTDAFVHPDTHRHARAHARRRRCQTYLSEPKNRTFRRGARHGLRLSFHLQLVLFAVDFVLVARIAPKDQLDFAECIEPKAHVPSEYIQTTARWSGKQRGVQGYN
ncbi:hypothetical protein AHF37_07838, partial [Paragonimus kellicotti]